MVELLINSKKPTELMGRNISFSIRKNIKKRSNNWFNNQFTILDNEDSKTMIKRIIQDHGLDKNIQPNSIFSKIFFKE